ncbi:MAG: glycoside hydrolase [Gemmatimonadetes bacterium]|nr:glycoside hydrolase [Gemmatimonadota bacterium]
MKKTHRLPVLIALLLGHALPVAAQARVDAPIPPSVGAFASGSNRNLFREWNPRLTGAAIQAKLEAYWQSLFGTGADRRVYYPSGANEHGPLAYVMDIGNDDIRSEGMSYGMMIAVQMNRKAEFDALWNWAKSNMQYRTGPRAGYFQWRCTPAGCPFNASPASDGEEYFATALFFAGHRWGKGAGIYDYVAEANAILDVMLHKEEMNGGVVDSVYNMFDRTQKQVVFVPLRRSASFTDPSYHLPAFYELWGRWAEGWKDQRDADRRFWLEAAQRSRRLFAQAAHPETGLTPDYSEFDGTPRHVGGHGDFRFDAHRTAVNWAVDYAWWAADANEKVLTDRLQAFFESQGMTTYANQYTVAGAPLAREQSSGLIASNGAASLAATHPRAWRFVEALWSLEPPRGRWRYYNGLLQFMAMLHASGNFRIH